LGFGEQEDVCLFESLENVELKQQLEASKTELEHARKSWKHIQEQNDSATQFILNMQEQLEALQRKHENLEGMYAMSDYLRENALSLSEERRVALEKCSPFILCVCDFCGYDPRIHADHEPSCDYVRLITQ
jgi:chromosome segregation ATPase